MFSGLCVRNRLIFCLEIAALGLISGSVTATDFYLTIAGGYARQGNQASMEANVLFFQEWIVRQSDSSAPHLIYFADGNAQEADVQIAESPDEAQPLTKVLSSVLDWESPIISYRTHQIEGVAGRNHPRDIRRGFEDLVSKLQSGDRLIIYVTAHGGSAPEKANDHDTSIHCWDGRQIRASEFAEWLDEVPAEVPVVMVMAQCYCGGFTHTIFTKADVEQGLARGLRCGFFAQQHDLPAAGCRPDVSNDDEYSSYFWGAMAGRSRTGTPIEGVDRNGDGKVSLIEAHTYAVIYSDTIDIPIRASEAYLRSVSSVSEEREPGQLCDLNGSLQEIVSTGSPLNAAVVRELAEQLQIPLSQSGEEVRKSASGPLRPMSRRGRGGGRGLRSRTQQLRDSVHERWPETTEIKSFADWTQAGLSAEVMWNEIQSWDEYKEFQLAWDARQQSRTAAEEAERRQVKLRRLLQAIETIVMEKNLVLIADVDTQERYRTMLDLEEICLK